MREIGGIRSALRRAGSLIAALILLSGCASTSRIADAPDMPRDGNVFLVRGLIDIFSLGLNDVRQQLLHEGVNAHTFSGPRWIFLAGQIESAYAAGELSDPIVVVGHSYGADDAVRICRALDRAKVPVEALVLIDPTTPPKVPANVRRCYNIYKSSPATDWMPVLRGVPVKADSEQTELINLDLRKAENAEEYRGLDHFDIEESPKIHAMVVREVLRHCPQRMAGAPKPLPGHVSASRRPADSDQPSMGALDGEGESSDSSIAN